MDVREAKSVSREDVREAKSVSREDVRAVRVACAVEGEAYVHHCAAMLHSLLANHPPGHVAIEYLHGEDTSERGRRRLASMVDTMGGRIRFHEIPDQWIAGLPVKGFTGKATWYRIFLPELLPECDRVIYLDSDLCATDSLDELMDMDLQGCVVGAVTNVPYTDALGRARRIGLPGDEAYFNAGVLVMGLDVMRREPIGRDVLEWARAHGDRYGWRDQDALNVVLHDRRLHLRPRWNCMNSIVYLPAAAEFFDAEQLAEAVAKPAIRHFEGPAWAKPWHLLSPEESRRLYLSHRRETPWPHTRPTGFTPGNVFRYIRRSRSSSSRSS